MPFMTLEAGDIFYEIHQVHDSLPSNQAIPVVILRPISRGPIGIGPFIELLAHHHPVINYDQRGMGQSPPGKIHAPVPMSARANEVFELLDALGLRTAHLVCHSTGCGIGLSMIAAQSERIATLTLVSPWAYGDAYLTRMQNLRIAAAKALMPDDYFRFNVSLLYPPEYRRQHEEGFAQMELVAADTEVNAEPN